MHRGPSVTKLMGTVLTVNRKQENHRQDFHNWVLQSLVSAVTLSAGVVPTTHAIEGHVWPLRAPLPGESTKPVKVIFSVSRRLLSAVDQLTVSPYGKLSCVQSVYLVGGHHHCKDYHISRAVITLTLHLHLSRPLLYQRVVSLWGKVLPLFIALFFCAANEPRCVCTL